MSNTPKTFHKRGNTSIRLINNSLLIINNDTLDKDTFAIKVCNNFYIELGRPLQDFKDVLMQADIPIVFEKITSMYGYTHYNIVRMETDDVKDIVLGTVICKEGIIEKITCDSKYKLRDDFNEHDSTGLLWKGGSFDYRDTGIKNREEAKKIALTLMSLNVNSMNNGMDNMLMFPNLGIVNSTDLDDVRKQIRKDNIETEFESGDIDEAYELVDEELSEEDSPDFEFNDCSDDLFTSGNETADRFNKQNVNKDDNELDVERLGNLEISTTYSTVKTEVRLKNVENNKEYKFTFILNELSRMYELISITLV